jgi:hypothetical protein
MDEERPMTERERIAHLLRRAGLGASEAELDYYERLGYRGAVDALLSYDKVPEDYSGLLAQIRGDAPQLRMPHVKAWWVARLLSTRRPLQERMVLFWHNHFATSASKVNRAELMLAQNETFRRVNMNIFSNTFGNTLTHPPLVPPRRPAQASVLPKGAPVPRKPHRRPTRTGAITQRLPPRQRLTPRS